MQRRVLEDMVLAKQLQHMSELDLCVAEGSQGGHRVFCKAGWPVCSMDGVKKTTNCHYLEVSVETLGIHGRHDHIRLHPDDRVPYADAGLRGRKVWLDYGTVDGVELYVGTGRSKVEVEDE